MIHFTEESIPSTTTTCSEIDSYSTLELPIKNELGQTDTLIVHAQRVLSSGSNYRATTLNDTTHWIDSPNLKQSIRMWIPFSENTALPPGQWTGSSETNVFSDGVQMSSIPIEIDLNLLQTQKIEAFPFESQGISAQDSSVYFLLNDPLVGPAERIWWGDSNPTQLTIPVVEQSSGVQTTLTLNAWKKSCDLGWGEWWSLNSGQTADSTCMHSVFLDLPDEGNEHLLSGHMYSSPESHPVVFEARRWHDPAAEALLQELSITVEHSVP